ncbi:MAG: hypothetical protein NC085_04075 [Muribaculaceae bacterium]|nr:hypothetical protein [Muribaculaceae bacterium]MCM1478854.1 hypothetical protein [Muribaculaceae bacterium]
MNRMLSIRKCESSQRKDAVTAAQMPILRAFAAASLVFGELHLQFDKASPRP